MSDLTYVYLIAHEGDPDPAFKVGIAADVWKRRDQIQIGNPIPLIVIWMMPCPTRRLAQEIERVIHTAFAEHSLHGEWFDCDMTTAGYEMTKIAHSYRRELGIQKPIDMLKFNTKYREAENGSHPHH